MPRCWYHDDNTGALTGNGRQPQTTRRARRIEALNAAAELRRTGRPGAGQARGGRRRQPHFQIRVALPAARTTGSPSTSCRSSHRPSCCSSPTRRSATRADQLPGSPMGSPRCRSAARRVGASTTSGPTCSTGRPCGRCRRPHPDPTTTSPTSWTTSSPRATATRTRRLYAFGQRWGPESREPDKIFGFPPGNGVHDIHMNQGNSGQFRTTTASGRTAACCCTSPPDQWVAIFLAFQSQAWHTDDRTGHTSRLEPLGPGPDPSPAEPDRIVRIVAALVNPIGPAPEPETVNPDQPRRSRCRPRRLAAGRPDG